MACLHGSTYTCIKHAKIGSDGLPLPGAECQFRFGVDGKPVLERGSVKNGKAIVYSDGTLEIDGVRVEVDGPNDQTAASRLQEEIQRASAARAKAVEDNVPSEDDDDDFIIRLRCGSTHINSYNWVVQQAIRSNTDIRFQGLPCLRTMDHDGDNAPILAQFSYKCPHSKCSAWIHKFSVRYGSDTTCLIWDSKFDDDVSMARNTVSPSVYKFAHLDATRRNKHVDRASSNAGPSSWSPTELK
ncbi:unnamed protein product [Ectocarpus sp. 13 AM-2016]